MNSFKRITAGLVALVTLSNASATILYQDDFDGLATDGLGGTTPDITTDGNAWAGGGLFNADGSVEEVPSNPGHSGAWLPFEPEAGNLYEATLTINPTSGGNNWISLGFAQQGFDDRIIDVQGSVSVWIRDNKATTNGFEYWVGLWNPGNITTAPPNLPDTAIDVKIILDATDADSSNWTAAFEVNGTAFPALTAGAGDLGNIQYVGISTSSAGGFVDDFQLSIVPEPGSLALLGMGCLTFMRRRRHV